jgi:hypothetical protein
MHRKSCGKKGQARTGTLAAESMAQIEGHNISTNAMVIDDIGNDEDAKSIEVLFGALLMQQWGSVSPPKKNGWTLRTIPENSLSSGK